MLEIWKVVVIITLMGLVFPSGALACNCGQVQKSADEKAKDEKLICEAPKEWLLAFKETKDIKNCDGNECKKNEGEIKR